MKYFLGLDNGGTTTKAAIYDREGKEICVASVETKMIVPAPGFVERDMDEMWEANCTVTAGKERYRSGGYRRRRNLWPW